MTRQLARLLWLALGAVFAGAALDALAWFLARLGPEAPDGAPWSLRGNGSLIVPFGLAPAILAGTWTALVLRARAAVGWLGLSVAAGLVGIGLVLAGMLALVGWGRLHAGQVAANWLFLSVLAWMALAPLVAAFAPVQRPPGAPRAAWAANLVGGILGTVLLVAGFVGLERLLPPGS